MNNAANSSIDSLASSDLVQHTKDKPTAEERMKQAVDRIKASRSALIVCLSPEPPVQRRNAFSRDDQGRKSNLVEALMARIKRNGLVQGSWGTVKTLSRRWWTRQPWHASVDLVAQTLAYQARPLMRRNPLLTLAVGAAVGAGFVATLSTARPWAWGHIQRHASPLRDRVGNLLWAQLTSAPVQMAVAGAIAAWVAEQTGPKRTSSKNTATKASSPYQDNSTATSPQPV